MNYLSKLILYFLTLMVLSISINFASYSVTLKNNKIEPDSGIVFQTMFISNSSEKFIPLEITPLTRENKRTTTRNIEINNDTDDILVVPYQVLLPPKGKQIVNVQYVGEERVETEMAYRLKVKEVPVDLNPDKHKNEKLVVTRIEFLKSLYVMPKEKFADVTALNIERKLDKENKMKLHIRLSNIGTIRAYLSGLTIEYLLTGGISDFFTIDVSQFNPYKVSDGQYFVVYPNEVVDIWIEWPKSLPRSATTFNFIEATFITNM